METITKRITQVKIFLETHHMYADNEWISGCVEYLCSDDDSRYTQSEINSLAREQWLLNDLKEICPGSLPAGLKDKAKTNLSGNFVLQINSILDIGTPAYQQYQKLQKVNTENVDLTVKHEDKVANHRMLKLHLTDGVQELAAIEYKPMRNMSCDVTPGCKMLLKGPVVCRRGMLLLTEPNVQLLGGEVDELVASSSLPELLSSKLGVSLNDPRQHPQSVPSNAVPQSSVNQHSTISQTSTNQSDQPQPKPVARVTSLQVANNHTNGTFDDDDIDFDQLAAIEEQITKKDNSSKRPFTKDITNLTNASKKPKINDFPRSLDYPDENCGFPCSDDEEYLREIEMEERDRLIDLDRMSERNSLTDSKQMTIGNSLVDSDRIKRSNFETPTSSMSNLKLPNRDSHSQISKSMIYPIKIPSEPFVYIKQIQEVDEIDRIGRVFRIKGQILKLLSKLSVGKEGWSLRCTLIDGTGSIDADFTSEVLTSIVGYTPEEMTKIRKEIATKPQMKEKALMALQNAKNKLQVLYCIIELTIIDGAKITGLVDFTGGVTRQAPQGQVEEFQLTANCMDIFALGVCKVAEGTARICMARKSCPLT